MDHHIPMILGGHLVPGNIVSLCRICNGNKLDQSPTRFYSEIELQALQPFLDQQEELFRFSFDWECWNEDREKYMLSLGIDSDTVYQVMHNPHHPDYVGTGSDQLGVVISLCGVSRL